MPKLRRLSGAEVIAVLRRFGFEVVSQRGSHIKLKRANVSGTQTLTVPAHAELDTGVVSHFNFSSPQAGTVPIAA